MNYPKETLAGMYRTDEPFLTSPNAPVMRHKFGVLPTLFDVPARVLSDPMNGYIRERKAENGVYNDLPKYSAFGAISKLWEDGDYTDIVKGMNADYEFNQQTLNAKFKPSEVYEFMRADGERYTDEVVKDFFATQYEDKEEQKRAFLMDYGVSPADAEQMLRKQRIDVAEAALKEFVANKRPMRVQGPRMQSIAANFMRNDVPMIEANQFFSPDGNLVNGITGVSMGAEMRPVRTRRLVQARNARAEEIVHDNAIDGLPVIPTAEAEKELRMLSRLEMLDKSVVKVKADAAKKAAKLERLAGFAERARRTPAADESRAKFGVELFRGGLAEREKLAKERSQLTGVSKKAQTVQMYQGMVNEESGFAQSIKKGTPRPVDVMGKKVKTMSFKDAEARLLKTQERLGVASSAGRPAASPRGAGEK